MSRSIAPEHARVDRDGRLVEASARLFALNARAGGEVGAVLAIPQLATLAQLVRTLRIPVARTVFAADGDADVELWVQSRPDGDGVAIAVAGWAPRAARKSWLVDQPDLQLTPESFVEWRWAVDTRLNLTEVVLDPTDAGILREADVLGKSLTRLVRLIEDDDGDLPILTALAEGAAFSGQRAVRRDRPDQEILLSGSPVFGRDGLLAGFAGQATALPIAPVQGADDTRALVDGHAFAERLSRALKQPLDRIVARADSIGAQEDGPLRRDYADYAGDIASAARHLLALVDDLADLEAVERADFALALEAVDLADIARRAAGLLGVRAADKAVRIDRPDPRDVLMARGDFRRVLQILVNLLTNAVRYSPTGSMVWLRTEADGDNVVVVVADQGKGIAAEDHDRIFDKFERVDPSEPGGSGLGLYISRRLARAMGGDITVDSAPGQGARLILTLPVA